MHLNYYYTTLLILLTNPSRGTDLDIYYTKTFNNLPEEKKNRILKTAEQEFAGKGYLAASIKIIAAKADISIGAMYRYFESKENLYMAIISQAFAVLENSLWQISRKEGTLFEKIEMMLHAIRAYAQNNPDLVRIYIDSTTEGVSALSSVLSEKNEAISAHHYNALIKEAKEQKLIAPGLDEGVAAYCIDNILMVYLFSNASEYYRRRMQIYAPNTLGDDNRMIDGIMQFIRSALQEL